MPDDRPVPEATTAARWWGQQLRDLAAALKPVAVMSEADFVGEADGIDAMFASCNYHMTIKLRGTLTEGNIARFEELLAIDIDAMMTAHPFGRCNIGPRGGYDARDLVLDKALEGAGIELHIAVMEPVFDSSMVTLVGPADVSATGGYTDESRATPLHQLPIIGV